MEEKCVRKRRRRSLRVSQSSISSDLNGATSTDGDKENEVLEEKHLGSTWMDISPHSSVILQRKNRRRSKQFALDSICISNNIQDVELPRSPDKKAPEMPAKMFDSPNLTKEMNQGSLCESSIETCGPDSGRTETIRSNVENERMSDTIPYSPSQTIWDNVSPLPISDIINTPVSPLCDDELVFYTPATDVKHLSKDRSQTNEKCTTGKKNQEGVSTANVLKPKKLATHYGSGTKYVIDKTVPISTNSSRAEEFLSICKSLAGRFTSLVKTNHKSSEDAEETHENSLDHCNAEQHIKEDEDHSETQAEQKSEQMKGCLYENNEEQIVSLENTTSFPGNVQYLEAGENEVGTKENPCKMDIDEMQSTEDDMDVRMEGNDAGCESSEKIKGEICDDNKGSLTSHDSDISSLKPLLCDDSFGKGVQDTKMTGEKWISPEKLNMQSNEVKMKNNVPPVAQSYEINITQFGSENENVSVESSSLCTDDVKDTIKSERKGRGRPPKRRKKGDEPSEEQKNITPKESVTVENSVVASSSEKGIQTLSKLDLDSLDEYLSIGESKPNTEKDKRKRGRPRRKSADFDIIRECQESVDSKNEDSIDNSYSSRRSSRLKRRSLELYKKEKESKQSHFWSDESGETDLPETQDLAAVNVCQVNSLDECLPNNDDSELECESSKVAMIDNGKNESSAKIKVPRKRRRTESEEEIKLLYLNKNFQKPTEGVWETIFESPNQAKNTEQIMSKRRYRRSISFDGYYFVQVAPLKQKKRIQKAIKQGWDPKKKRTNSIPDAEILERLENLDKDLGEKLSNA